MAGQRKLMSEIDRTLKKVTEGVDVFNDIWEKVYSASAQNQKEKHEADLKKEIKKLQRFRDQIKNWIGNSDVKDKKPLTDARKLIEQKMEEFKVCEKETKTKAYSKEGLAQVERLDPAEQAKQNTRNWIQDCLTQFNEQIEGTECDLERLQQSKGKNKNKAEIEALEYALSRHKFHVLKLEQIIRLLDNDALECTSVDELKDDIEYYLEANQEPDFMETYGEDDIYEPLDLDTLGAAIQVGLPTEVDVGLVVEEKEKEKEDIVVVAPSASSGGRSSKTPKKQITANVIAGIGRPGAVKAIDLKTTPTISTPVRGSSASSLSVVTPNRKDQDESNSNKNDDKKVRGTPHRGGKPPTAQTPTPTAASEREDKASASAATTPSSTASADRGSDKKTSPGSARKSPMAPRPDPVETATSSLPPPAPTTPVGPTIAAVIGGSSSASVSPQPAPVRVVVPELTEEQRQILRMIDASFYFMPESRDSEKVNRYVPRNLYPTPASFPSTPTTLFDNAAIFEKLDVDSLFFIFYYQQGSYQQYLAARELKRRTWGYHKKYKTWFKRHEEPQVTGEDYEQGTFVYFDYETGWCQRIKTEFTFEYSYLEDELITSAAPYAISLASIRDAARRIDGLAHRTPVITCRALDAIASKAHGQPLRLFFKCENLQKVGAFKYRGALNAVRKHLDDRRVTDANNRDAVATFVTHSSGNHAQALALAAKDAGCRAVIVMPQNAPQVKQRAVAGYDAQIVLCEPILEARDSTAKRECERTNGTFVHPSNDPDVMSGQGTVGLELLEQVEAEHGVQLDAVLMPIGGGGLASGIAMAVKSMKPETTVLAVEPVGAADAHASFRAGQLQGHTTPPLTIADGLKTTLDNNNWPVIQHHVDDILLVTDDEIVATMRLMWERMKLVVEPSGAVATAALIHGKLPSNTNSAEVRNIGIVISGGNVDLDNLPWMTK
ncbi:TPA: hypothetical protein N0F65_003902 [Lagenidium giganteum]|uniref:Serine racemase n=1 Tax=Lagenidium giganteum TaxID=4803 RepID=A0AAV2ZCB0_9STRA|nr:TPA: hypothetical protein N0F65_003902 [Lagenidium giganteum]